MTWQQGVQVRGKSRSAAGKPVSGRALRPGWRFIKKSEHVLSLPSLPSCPFQPPQEPRDAAFPVSSPSALLPAGIPCLQAGGGDGAGGRPCRLDRAQTPFSDVTSRGGPEVSATSSPIHQEAGNMTVLGDTCRDKQGQRGVAKLRKREAGGLFP